MKIAILGAGYVANMYRLTLPLHPTLELVGVFDHERSRCENMARLTGVRSYASMDELLADDTQIVLNLTNPRAHFQTSKRLLEAGKHVYTEKPVAMDFGEAKALTALAAEKERLLISAPCTIMSPAAQALWSAVREGMAGDIRLIYAEMDDGMVAKAPVRKWISEAGTPWPFVDEFETGCTVEHAGYVMTWLCAMFGPAVSVTAFADHLQPNKVPGQVLDEAPDFSVACIKFAGGQVARMTNGIYADHDHRLRLFGDDGVLTVKDPRSDDSSVSLQKYQTIRRKRFLSPFKKKIRHQSSKEVVVRYRGSQTRDFCRVIANIAAAIGGNDKAYVSNEFSLHITEITLACQRLLGGDEIGGYYKMTTDFEPMEPLT